jgi:nucleoid-associated protein YgaU
MRLNNYLFLSLLLLFVLPSCGDKEEEVKNVTTPVVQEEVVKVDTLKPEPVVEKKVEKPQPVWPKRVVVQEGEWIYDIARREYGSIFAWKKIYDANQNKISDPDLIYPGQELVLPE